MSRQARQRRDKRAEIPDEAALSRLMTNGAEAWRDVTDAAAWVDELRGNTMTDTTDQFQPLRDAPTPIGPDVGSGRNVYFAGQHSAEEPADTAVRLALVAQRDALLAEVERQAAALKKYEADDVRYLATVRARDAEVERLTAELAAARVDAERYRWLRERVPGSTYRIMGVIYSEGGAGVDAAIDAARTA